MTEPVLARRRSGVVLHLSSLPGPHGSGDLGPEAHRFVDWLASARQSVWQVLPLGPVGYGNSPYQSPSAFAGNPLFVALEPLVERGWLDSAALRDAPFDAGPIDFARAIPWRMARLRAAWARFEAGAMAAVRDAHRAWCEGERDWLEDYALFMAIKSAHQERPWWDWPPVLRAREPAALAAARAALRDEIAFRRFAQWCFAEQLDALRAHAARRGVRMMGDVPIFIAHDSADCWSRPDLYHLDRECRLTVVSGAPPDGYTADGQRWGNPLYRWDRMAAEGFGWWIARPRRALAQADLVRIDHFRGFAGCWEIPAHEPTARGGRWAPGPGAALFEAVEAALGRLPDEVPIVAEDLGLITPDVIALRERFGLSGMRIVYEGFIYGADHPFLPHHHEPRAIAYTSTHDSDTVRGWWRASTPAERTLAATYLDLDAGDDEAPVHRRLHAATLASVAGLALAPMQDLLGLGSEHRMNRPGTGDGNWGWRFDWAEVDPALAPWLAGLTAATDRVPDA